MGNLSFNTLRKLSNDENDYRNAVKAVERFLNVMENEFHENATVSQKRYHSVSSTSLNYGCHEVLEAQ